MLVLGRHEEESIVIDFSKMTDAELLALRETPINILTCDIRTGPKVVRLGIDAPRSVQVHRREIWDTIQRDGPKAAYAQSRHAAMVARG